MGARFIPDREADLINWASNFATKIAATPTAFGLTAAQASAFQGLLVDFEEAYATATDRATRSPMNIELKNVAKDLMVKNARVLAGVVQKFPAITNAQRISLGLTVRADPKPRPVPLVAPFINVTMTNGRTVSIELRQDTAKRGRPAGVASASVFTAPAGTSTADTAAWAFYANTNKTTVDVAFPPSATGDAVQITAFWNNSRSESGPSANPVTVNLPASGQLPTAKHLKIAA